MSHVCVVSGRCAVVTVWCGRPVQLQRTDGTSHDGTECAARPAAPRHCVHDRPARETAGSRLQGDDRDPRARSRGGVIIFPGYALYGVAVSGFSRTSTAEDRSSGR